LCRVPELKCALSHRRNDSFAELDRYIDELQSYLILVDYLIEAALVVSFCFCVRMPSLLKAS
jgi:hypothetical protein